MNKEELLKEALARVAVLRIEPGDSLVLRVESNIDDESAEWMRRRMADATGLDVKKCIVLGPGADLEILREAEIPDEPL